MAINIFPKYLSKLSGIGPQPVLTLNIHSNGIRFVAVDGQTVTAWGDKEFEKEAVRDGLIVHPELISKAIEEIRQEQKLTDNVRIVSTVSGMRSLPRLINIPNIERKLLPEAVRFESERQMPLPLNELYVAEKQLADSGAGHVFYVVGISKALVEAHVDALSMARLKFFELDIKPIALARAVNTHQAMILDMEPGYTEIVLTINGVPILMRTIIMGGNYMPIEERVRQVSVEVSRTIEYNNSINPENPFDRDQPIFLTGKLTYANALVELLKSSVVNPIQQIQPGIELPDRFPVSEYAVNLGLLMKRPLGERDKKNSSAYPALEISIVPPGYNVLSSPMKTLLVGLLAALFLILLIPMAKFDMDRNIEASELSQELERINLSLNETRELSKAVRETKSEASQLFEEANAVIGVSSGFSDGLKSVFANVPSELTLTSVAITNEVIGVDGFSRERSSVIRYASSLEAQEGISNVHIASLTATESQSGEPLVKFSIEISR